MDKEYDDEKKYYEHDDEMYHDYGDANERKFAEEYLELQELELQENS